MKLTVRLGNRNGGVALAALALLLGICAVDSGSATVSSDVVVLTDENFDRLVSDGGEAWLVKVYAPWCVHCKALEPVWEQLASRVKENRIPVRVGKIDGVKEKMLLARFRVEGFPSIFHISASGDTREFTGARTVAALETFVTAKWVNTDPLPFWRSPASPAGRILSFFFSIPTWVQRAYHRLHEELGYSELTILAGTLAVPLVIGIFSICMLDAFYSRQPMQGTPPAAHQHAE